MCIGTSPRPQRGWLPQRALILAALSRATLDPWFSNLRISPPGTFLHPPVSIPSRSGKIRNRGFVVADTTVGLAFNPVAEQNPSADAMWLLEGLRAGAEDAFEALITRYQQPVYNLVYRLMDDPADTNDVVQEVFLKVFRNVGAFRGNSSLKTWIYRIAVNEAYNQRRWFSRHRRKEVGLEEDEENSRSWQDVLCDPALSPFDVAAGHEARELVENALTKVNPLFRAAVVLRDIEDFSYEEISEVLQVSIGTVKSRILRGRDALRKSLEIQLEPGLDRNWKAQPVD